MRPWRKYCRSYGLLLLLLPRVLWTVWGQLLPLFLLVQSKLNCNAVKRSMILTISDKRSGHGQVYACPPVPAYTFRQLTHSSMLCDDGSFAQRHPCIFTPSTFESRLLVVNARGMPTAAHDRRCGAGFSGLIPVLTAHDCGGQNATIPIEHTLNHHRGPIEYCNHVNCGRFRRSMLACNTPRLLSLATLMMVCAV